MTTRQPVHDVPGLPVGDDFTRIHGIGPGIASRLQHAGILRFTQLASLSAQEIVAATGSLIGLTVERVEQQDWAGQARELSDAGLAQLTDERGEHLHYAAFTVELLLDEENRARRTRLVDVRAGEENAWAGWDAERLLRFFMDQSGLRTDLLTAAEQPVRTEPAGAPAEVAEALPSAALPTAEPAQMPESAQEEAPEARVEAQQERIEIERVAALHPQTGLHNRALPSGEEFTLTMRLDLSRAGLVQGTPLCCRAVAQAKEIASGARLLLAEWDQAITLSDMLQIAYQHPGLPKGIYRLETAVTLYPEKEAFPGSRRLTAFREGELLQVF